MDAFRGRTRQTGRGRVPARQRTAQPNDFPAGWSAGSHSRVLCWLSVAASLTLLVMIYALLGYGYANKTSVGDGYLAPGGRLLLSTHYRPATCTISTHGLLVRKLTLQPTPSRRFAEWDGEVLSPQAGSRITCGGNSVYVLAGWPTFLSPLAHCGFLTVPLLIWCATAATLLVRQRRPRRDRP